VRLLLEVLAALAVELPTARVHGVAAGLHVLLELPPGADEALLVDTAEREGLRLYGLARHCCGPPPFPGIVLGYANASPAELTRAVRRIARLLAAQGDGAGDGPRP
jgi:GntR family transcriptional regulator/MocR family aminotransferase